MNQVEPVDPPVTVTTSVTYSSFSVSLVSLQLNQSASFSVTIYDANNSVIAFKTLVMSGQDYTNWTTDDYVYTWVNQQLQQM